MLNQRDFISARNEIENMQAKMTAWPFSLHWIGLPEANHFDLGLFAI